MQNLSTVILSMSSDFFKRPNLFQGSLTKIIEKKMQQIWEKDTVFAPFSASCSMDV